MIEIEALNKIYGIGKVAVNALNDVALSVNKGEFVSIMGPSGSGKSTLLNILGCLDRPTNGVYRLDNVLVSNLSEVELAHIRNQKIGFVFQSFNLLPRFNALHNVELPMIYSGIHHKERRERAIVALDKVGLKDRMLHKPNEMSGGQKQRVAIARALVNQPAILLADEPTGNLDSTSSEEIISIFQQLNQEGVTIILVTHEADIAQHTHRVIKFYDGRLDSDEKIDSPLLAKGVSSNIKNK